MRIVLVRPPFVDIRTGPPIGLAYLSRVLKESGHEVSIIDVNIDINNKYSHIGDYNRDFRLPESHPAVDYVSNRLEDYSRDILSLSPDIVGFSLSYPTVEWGIAMAQKISGYVRCIAGGPEATFNEKKLLNTGCFDTIISGYGEEAVLKAVNKGIKGIISKKLVKSKDYLPDYSDLPIENYNGRLPVITARGCPYRCNFCTQHLHYFPQPIESVVNQVKNTPNIREVMYNDSNINADEKRTEQLFTELAGLKEIPKGKIFGLAIRKGFKRYVSKMAASGVKVVRLGIESGSLRERKSMHKSFFDNDTVIQLVKELTFHQITTVAQYIFCYPDQIEADRQETVKLMQQINDTCDANYVKHLWYKFVVHHGTEKFFKRKYGVTAFSPQNWGNRLYSPEKIEEIGKQYSHYIPGNAAIFR